MTFILSLDPAQLRDWSALCALNMHYVNEKRRFQYDLVAMNRKQQLPYPEIVDWSVEAYINPAFKQGDKLPEFLVDSTGVGVAIRDMLRAKGIKCKAITVTAGNSVTREGPLIHVGKARLIGKFLGAFDAGKVRINPNLPIWPKLEREMLSYRAEMSAQGRAKFESEEGEHDDMIFALAQGVWYGEEILRGGKLQ